MLNNSKGSVSSIGSSLGKSSKDSKERSLIAQRKKTSGSAQSGGSSPNPLPKGRPSLIGRPSESNK